MTDSGKPDLIESVLYAWGDDEMTRDQQQRHVAVFVGAPGPVLEIGCGRGTMLEMLRDAGVKASGIDTSPTSLSFCRDKNLDVLEADALDHLGGLREGALGGVFCAHVIEHLHPPQVAQLILESYRGLAPDGRLTLVTPNARDLRIVERFWLDPTHVRPYPQKLLCAMLANAGFTAIRVSETAEPASNILVRVAKFLLRMWFMGFLFRGDLVVTARKPSVGSGGTTV